MLPTLLPLTSTQSMGSCGEDKCGGTRPSISARDSPYSIQGLLNHVCRSASPLLPGLHFAFLGRTHRQLDLKVQGRRAGGDTGSLRFGQGDPQHCHSCPAMLPRGCWTKAAHSSFYILPQHGTAQHKPSWFAQTSPKSGFSETQPTAASSRGLFGWARCPDTPVPLQVFPFLPPHWKASQQICATWQCPEASELQKLPGLGTSRVANTVPKLSLSSCLP